MNFFYNYTVTLPLNLHYLWENTLNRFGFIIVAKYVSGDCVTYTIYVPFDLNPSFLFCIEEYFEAQVVCEGVIRS